MLTLAYWAVGINISAWQQTFAWFSIGWINLVALHFLFKKLIAIHNECVYAALPSCCPAGTPILGESPDPSTSFTPINGGHSRAAAEGEGGAEAPLALNSHVARMVEKAVSKGHEARFWFGDTHKEHFMLSFIRLSILLNAIYAAVLPTYAPLVFRHMQEKQGGERAGLIALFVIALLPIPAVLSYLPQASELGDGLTE